MILSDRQWHQCRAALVFWQAVAGSSRVHPTQHPGVRGMFGDGKPSPLTDTEIREVLALREVRETAGHTIKAYALAVGVPSGTLAVWLKKDRTKPVNRIGNTNIYAVEDLRATCLRKINPRWGKNYAIPAVQPEA